MRITARFSLFCTTTAPSGSGGVVGTVLGDGRGSNSGDVVTVGMEHQLRRETKGPAGLLLYCAPVIHHSGPGVNAGRVLHASPIQAVPRVGWGINKRRGRHSMHAMHTWLVLRVVALNEGLDWIRGL